MKTLDDIIPPSRRQSVGEAPPPEPAPSRPRSRSRFPLGTLLVVLLIIAASIGALFYFSSAEVSVTPLTRSASLADTKLTATTGSGDLTFQVLTVQKVQTQSVASSGTKAVSSSAKGTITIYNTQKITQKLVANTRFQSPSGLIYKISSAVSIPPAKADVPGSVTAQVTAASTGSEYNIGPTTFTVPGLSGSPQYTEVTGKSTTAMTGGASGNEPVVDQATESATRGALTNSLAKDLETELAAQIPDGYVLVNGASDTTYAPQPTTAGATSGQADLKEQGTARAVVFPKTALAKAIATNALGAGYKGEAVTLQNGDALTLTPQGSLPGAADQSFAFMLSGTAMIQSVVDPSRVAAAIAGKSASEAEAALKQYPEIFNAVLVLKPFWRTTYPEDPAKITVHVVSPAGN